ncbi:MAG: hypothetical protein ACRDMV_11535 [Streptosporangiales bacterium]
MKSQGTVALGIAIGYALGRTKKMKLALMLGAVAAGKRLDRTALLEQGKNLLESSPALQRIGGDARGRLADAGREAAAAAAGKGMDALSDRLQQRATQLRSPGSEGTGEEEPPADEEPPSDEQPADDDEESADDEEEPEPEPEPQPARKRSSSSRGGSTSSRRKSTSSSRSTKSSSRQRGSKSNG